MRTIVVLALLVATAGSAHADPITTIAIGPEGPADPHNNYYLAVDVGDVEGPREGDTETDACESDVVERAAALVPPPDLRDSFSITPFTPTCVSTIGLPCSPPGCVTFVSFSYDVTTGRYFADAQLSVPDQELDRRVKTIVSDKRGTGQGGESAGLQAGLPDFPQTGKTGVGIRTNCEGCPPPVCC